MQTRVIVSAIIEHEGRFLLGRKPKDVGPYPNTWHLVGGGINLGDETAVEAIQREVREEANIFIKNIQPVSFDEDKTYNKKGERIHYIFLIFIGQYHAGTMQPGDDIKELRWFGTPELKEIILTPPSAKLFKKLEII